MKIKRIHTTGKNAIDQQDVCGDCFVWINHDDSYCWSCGIGFEEDSAYNLEELLKSKSK